MDQTRHAESSSPLEKMSNFTAIVGPMQERLSLPRTAEEVTWLAVPLDLPNVPPHCFPSLDLPSVFVRHPTAHVVAAIPLEPTARIVRMKPCLMAPNT
jgi:hypothetical protein